MGQINTSDRDLYNQAAQAIIEHSDNQLKRVISDNSRLLANIDFPYDQTLGDSLLHTACRHNSLSCVKALLQIYGADPYKQSEQTKQTPLVIAVRGKNFLIAEYLLYYLQKISKSIIKLHAIPNFIELIFEAIDLGDTPSIRFLLSAGFNTLAISYPGRPQFQQHPIFYAIEQNQLAMALCFLDKDQDRTLSAVKVQTKETPIMFAKRLQRKHIQDAIEQKMIQPHFSPRRKNNQVSRSLGGQTNYSRNFNSRQNPLSNSVQVTEEKMLEKSPDIQGPERKDTMIEEIKASAQHSDSFYTALSCIDSDIFKNGRESFIEGNPKKLASKHSYTWRGALQTPREEKQERLNGYEGSDSSDSSYDVLSEPKRLKEICSGHPRRKVSALDSATTINYDTTMIRPSGLFCCCSKATR